MLSTEVIILSNKEDIEKVIEDVKPLIIESINSIKSREYGEMFVLSEDRIITIIKMNTLVILKNKDNNDIIGYASIIKLEAFKDAIFINDIFVRYEYRGRRYGHLLMDEIIDEFRDSCSNIILNSDIDNYIANRFYKKLGFEITNYTQRLKLLP
jgi:ribosomal protein S18 acetylase RimI-like enzyme